MPKIKIIRAGARRPVSIDAKLAHHLVKTRNWEYASEDKISRPKRKAKKDNAARSHEAEPVILNKTTGEPVQAKEETAQPEAVETSRVGVPISAAELKNVTMSAGKPMTSARFTVKPTRVAAMTHEQLEEMTKADLKVLGNKLGVDLKPAEPKAEWVKKLTRYMRRDMRAER